MIEYMPFVTGIAAMFFIFVVPLWIFFNYLGKVKANKALSKEDEQMLEDLWIAAKKIETRVETLETILNDK